MISLYDPEIPQGRRTYIEKRNEYAAVCPCVAIGVVEQLTTVRIIDEAFVACRKIARRICRELSPPSNPAPRPPPNCAADISSWSVPLTKSSKKS